MSANSRNVSSIAPRRTGGGQSEENKKELSVLEFVHEHPSINHLGDSPTNVASTIELFKSVKGERLMTIGPVKAEYIINKMAKLPPGPKTFIEFGAYVGYSATILAGALRDLNKGYPVKYYSLEVNPVNAAITSSFIELAGLQSVVQVFVGSAADSLTNLVEQGVLEPGQVDFILLDHFKNFYLPDLKVMERLSLLKTGSIIFADNCGPALRPDRALADSGIIEYVDYVKKGIPENTDDFLYNTELVDFQYDAIAVSEIVPKS
ncbi:S-adenosyl-L-methionine-dependent methyltransferase [Dipodascopsis uninucleata]